MFLMGGYIMAKLIKKYEIILTWKLYENTLQKQCDESSERMR